MADDRPQGGQTPVTEVVHVRHFIDGYPLCWPMDRDGEFVGEYDESKATCEECLAIL